VDIHFIHVKSPHENALPLVMTHGWPGSVIEPLETVGPLTDPTAHGGVAEGAFHLVLPSLPGYAFSFPACSATSRRPPVSDASSEDETTCFTAKAATAKTRSNAGAPQRTRQQSCIGRGWLTVRRPRGSVYVVLRVLPRLRCLHEQPG
jgi:Epoxide hydrolase N terminus